MPLRPASDPMGSPWHCLSSRWRVSRVPTRRHPWRSMGRQVSPRRDDRVRAQRSRGKRRVRVRGLGLHGTVQPRGGAEPSRAAFFSAACGESSLAMSNNDLLTSMCDARLDHHGTALRRSVLPSLTRFTHTACCAAIGCHPNHTASRIPLGANHHPTGTRHPRSTPF